MKKIIIVLSLIIITFTITENCSKIKNKVTENTISTSSTQELNSEPIFTSQRLPNYIYEKMLGKSIPLEYKNSVNINSLSYLQISYIGFDNESHIGEMVVNSKISDDVLEIFKELYSIKYPIERINLIDDYNADDELSMSNNNTSCFCYRLISGTNRPSNHAKGTAIDINPLYNPFVTNVRISPQSGAIYADRNINCKYQISKNDELYKIFIKHGWSWGGNWSKSKDYQHFEKQE